MAKNQKAKQELTPKREVASQEETSKFQIKEKHVNKVKTYIEKKTGLQKEFEADWRKLVVNGNHLTLFKGQPLTKSQLSLFDDKAREYWLEEIK